MKRTKGLIGLAAAAVLVAGCGGGGGGGSKVVYSNGFQSAPGPEWSSQITDRTPTGSRPFLGQFRDGTVSLTLGGLPAHSTVTVSLDLFLIRAWHGPNWPDIGVPPIWDFGIEGGQTLIHTTFDNNPDQVTQTQQSYPGTYPVSLYPSHTGAAELQTLGYYYNGSGTLWPLDSVYRITRTFTHSATSLVLDFAATNLGTGLDSSGNPIASWGLTNVEVRTNS